MQALRQATVAPAEFFCASSLGQWALMSALQPALLQSYLPPPTRFHRSRSGPAPLQLVRAQTRPAHPSGTLKVVVWYFSSANPPPSGRALLGLFSRPGHTVKGQLFQMRISWSAAATASTAIRAKMSPVSQVPAPLQPVRAQTRPAQASGTWRTCVAPAFSSNPPASGSCLPGLFSRPGQMGWRQLLWMRISWFAEASVARVASRARQVKNFMLCYWSEED
ncbi:hypothetical protein TYRP_011993 [Tyrophagus putrescentiae]|nr:hypothetical protein TYRP_011993 [Tyrophagus putrescentiae]